MGYSFLINQPYSSAKYYSHKYINKVKELIALQQFDAVIIDHAQLGWLARIVAPKHRLIVNTHNIEHQIYLNYVKGDGNPLLKIIYKREAFLIKKMEDDLAQIAQEVWTLTSKDCQYFSEVKSTGKVRFFAIPSSIEAEVKVKIIKNFDVGLIGSWTWKANAEGLMWFFEQVYPLLPQEISIRVAGKGADWLLNKYPNVKYCGFVPDAQEFMTEAKVVAIPSISGAGIQIKTLDAIASGATIIATPFALRGLTDYPSCVQQAATPQEFSDRIRELVNLTPANNSSQEAIVWSKNRQQQFIADVAEAISDR